MILKRKHLQLRKCFFLLCCCLLFCVLCIIIA